MNKLAHILKKGNLVADNYKVTFFLKKGSYAETYRVKDNDGITKLLKLFIYSQLDRTQFTEEGLPLEVVILKKLNHPNLVRYHDSGELLLENQKFAFVILDFISGETLADKMRREDTLNQYEAKDIILGVLNGLNYLHSLDKPIIHNDITNLNVMLDLSGSIAIPKAIDFGYARFLHQPIKDFQKEGLNPFYMANETFNRVFSIQSDIFAVGALYYHLLYGLPPWFKDTSRYASNNDELADEIIQERKKKLHFMESTTTINTDTINIIKKALHPNPEYRFSTAKEFIQTLNGELEVQLSDQEEAKKTIKPTKPKKGKGFSAIAGMDELKEMLQLDVIDALNDKEKYAEYGLTIPNGMLLYGPPGCGKTFFAEKLAEEIGFNFYQIKPSDIQSRWVNATQENIKELFDDARENAPSIIFIDELDALVPNRDTSGVNHMNKNAVNEFLAQMNNAGEDNVFIIGATNRPTAIDPAILRAGRLDKHILLPPPDFKARKLMFELHLKNRKIELGLNYEKLAELTENYVSSDIKFLSDEASRAALRLKARISNEILLETIKNNRPSITLKEINSYTNIKAKLEGDNNNNKKNKIGF